MNYHHIYNQLVISRQNIILESDYHNHHIIPRCLGGADEPENLVRLSYREHFVVHQLLVKIYPDNRDISYAACCMSNFKKYTGKKYSWLIKLRKDIGLKQSTKNKLSKAKKGIPNSEESKIKCSNSHKGKIKSETHKNNISKAGIGNKNAAGHKVSEESKQRIRDKRALQVSPIKGKKRIFDEQLQRYRYI